MNLSNTSKQKIAPCLWFNGQAEEAVAFYVSVFPDSRVTHVSRFTEAGFEHHGMPPGTVMALGFELCGQPFTVINGGPAFKLNEAMSLIIHCDTQEEIDHYWDLLGEGGDPACQACGWLKDRFGLSWQVVPGDLLELVSDPATAEPVLRELHTMTKLEIHRLRQAAASRTL